METIKLIEELEIEAFGEVRETTDVNDGDILSQIDAVENILNEL